MSGGHGIVPGKTIPAPGTADYNNQSAHYGEDLRPGGTAGLVITIVAATITLGTRLYQARKRTGSFALSDYFISAAWLIALYMTITVLVSFRYGMGLHQLRVIDGFPKLDIVTAFETAYFVSVMQAPCFLFIKLALLHYYQKIFYIKQRYLKYWLWFNAIYALLWTIGTFFYFLLRCLPVSYNWRLYEKFYGVQPPQNVYCVDNDPNPKILNNSVIIGILGLISDVFIIMTPIVMLRGLQIGRGKKLALALLFTIGFLAIAVSIVRIVFFNEQSRAIDLTWVLYPSAVWLDVEVNVAIFCANIPPSNNTLKLVGMRFWSVASSIASSAASIGSRGRQEPSDQQQHAEPGASSDGQSPRSQSGVEDNGWVPKDRIGKAQVISQSSDVELGTLPRSGWE